MSAPHFSRSSSEIQASRKLDAIDAALYELSAAWHSLRRSNAYRPDLSSGAAFSSIITAVVELKAEREKLLAEVGL